jgi:membrane protease YdiL (CAAX protease family)
MYNSTKQNNIRVVILLGSLPLLLNGLYNNYLSYVPILYWMVEILTWICLPIILYYYGYKKALFTNREIGFHKLIRTKDSWLLFIIVTFVTAVILNHFDNILRIISFHLFPINYGAGEFNYKNLVPNAGILKFIVTIYFSLSAGIVEEFYYRGLMSKLFNKTKASYLLYIIISSLVWAVLHWEAGIRDMFAFFFLGISLATLYKLYGNIWPLILSHILIGYKWFS